MLVPDFGPTMKVIAYWPFQDWESAEAVAGSGRATPASDAAHKATKLLRRLGVIGFSSEFVPRILLCRAVAEQLPPATGPPRIAVGQRGSGPPGSALLRRRAGRRHVGVIIGGWLRVTPLLGPGRSIALQVASELLFQCVVFSRAVLRDTTLHWSPLCRIKPLAVYPLWCCPMRRAASLGQGSVPWSGVRA